MVLLLSKPDLNEGEHQNPGAEEHTCIEVQPHASHLLEHFSILALYLFELLSYGIEAVIDVFLIRITSWMLICLLMRNNTPIVSGRLV